ncbi:acyl-CoA N-acyltransferase [Corynespora cassiicola Philippines]|uniref:Acyl-CoA N-acyltransferase n=1 Tax=Corynespora cassiicola Philippines TaxID=1448308 RepID=A0A2T2P2C2_CORCC|nr:acyl-CoA N-acyltransferase [Corynespora cassiicola Philippines]
MPPPPAPQDPFRTPRLHLRAVDLKTDIALFTTINNDTQGFQNSNSTNIKLPGPSDAEAFAKGVANDCLVGAVLCLAVDLPVAPPGAAAVDVNEEEEEEEEDDEELRAVEPTVHKAGTPVGQLNLKPLGLHTSHHRSTELAIDILPAFQGRGLGAEAIRWALAFAFRRAGLHKVRVRAFEWNEGAGRLYKRLGFTLEGREREAYWHEGRFWDSLEFGMIDREWWGMQKQQQQQQQQ